MAKKQMPSLGGVQIPTKRLAIDKAQAQTVVVVAVAAFVTVFCLVAAKAVFSQNQYQARVTSKKEAAHKQLLTNISAFNSLVTHYQAFDSAPTNVIGGNAGGTGDKDGPNSKIILDALPPTYDFPALTSSLEKILDDRGLKVSSIAGTDDQLNQQNNGSSPNPQPVSIPFTFTVNASYSSAQQLIQALQQSIRPIAIDTMTLSGGASNMAITVNAHTYYQPAKAVSITKQAVK
ncbi:MAG TPA: hypothetical protein VH234_02425 [Candidatus Saccharimonadales bacterium]|jgi:hypothetical protein|nr:hypothetical protein [Candidatus Saccharimonadales bacterium]